MSTKASVPDPRAIMTEMMQSGEFEVVAEDVRGVTMSVFANRFRSLREVLADSDRHGDTPFLFTADREFSYHEHYVAATSMGVRLREEYGVKPGDRVGIIGNNSPEWIMAFWAAAWAGAIPVGFNSWWSKGEVQDAIANCEPVLLVVDEPSVRLVPEGMTTIRMPGDVDRLTQPLEDAGDLQLEGETNEDDPAAMLYTSGTTGQPKGVVYSHRNFAAAINFHTLNDELRWRMGESKDLPRRDLLISPLFHIAGLHNLAVARLAAGTGVVIYEGRYDAVRALDLIQDRKVTNWGAVPTMVSRMLDHDLSRWDLSSLRAFALASAPSSIEFKQRVREAFPVAQQALTDSYGMTETSTAITVAPQPLLEMAPGTVGTPPPTVEVTVRKSDGTEADDGEPGEVWVRSQFNMLGYWDNPEATEEALTDDQWLRTGDLGRMVQGLLFLDVRRSDLIIRGGENIRPGEIHEVLMTHPDVLDVAVVGLDHDDLGQEVGALVAVREDADVDADGLREHLTGKIAKFKIPTRWSLTTERLPRNATGKVMRIQVMDQLAAE